jgi:hypothetical protein
MDITPGSKVKVTVSSFVKSDAANKTLGRLFVKDPAIGSRRKSEPKGFKSKIRGGRVWRHTHKGSVTRPPKLGESCVIQTTVDIVRDLASVERYIKVSPA